jgi:predicted acetyltransferase
MSVEIRPPRDDEAERFHFVVAYAFSGDRSEEARRSFQHVVQMTRAFALYDDGEMAACLRVYPFSMRVNGASVPLGGVSSVACLPEHRRKGYVGRLLRHALADMRDRGEVLSALYTPHPSLYRRFGWMVAATSVTYTFDPKQVSPHKSARPAGGAYRVSNEDWPTVADIYQRFTAPRNGYLERSELWWKEGIFHHMYDTKRRKRDVAVWADESGRPQGYVAYTAISDHRPGPEIPDKLLLHELVALQPDAHLGLLRYLLTHDLAGEITWHDGFIDDPIALALDDSYRVKREQQDGFMLRVVDVEKAVAARAPAFSAPDGAFTVHITDASCPWNQGAWRIQSGGGRLTATRHEGPADLNCDASTFAALYNGFLKPSEAARAGLAEAADPTGDSLSLADRILATNYPPVSSDFF